MSADVERTAGLVQSEFLSPVESDVYLQREPTVTRAATFPSDFRLNVPFCNKKLLSEAAEPLLSCGTFSEVGFPL